MRIPIVLERIPPTEGGMTCGWRRLWLRNSNSSRRSHALPGRLGKPTVGRSGVRGRAEEVEGSEWNWFKATKAYDTAWNWKARMLGNKHVRFGGGADRKGRKHLAGGLLYTVTLIPKEAA